MYLESMLYSTICQILGVSETDTSDDLAKLKKSISVLHDRYLIGAVTEANHIISKTAVSDRFGLIMSIYNRKIKEHQALFLLIHLFEIAIRSKAAIIISNHFSTPGTDDWFRSLSPQSHQHSKLIQKIQLIAKNKHFTIGSDTNTFDLFHLFSFGDLEFLLKTFWSEFEPLFLSKQYKSQSLPAIKIKESFLKKIMEIRHSRNDIFHNNPPKIKRGKLIEHIELILLHLGYNLFDAVNNIDPEHKIIQLKYIY